VTRPIPHRAPPTTTANAGGRRPRSRSHAAGNAVPAWQTVHNASAQTTSVSRWVSTSTGTTAPNPYCWTPAASIAAQADHNIQFLDRPSSSRSDSPTRYRLP
jgi:hypothetical protein